MSEEWTYHEVDEVDEYKAGSKLVLESTEPDLNKVELSYIKGRFDMKAFHLSFTGVENVNPGLQVWGVMNVVLEDEYTQKELQTEENHFSVLTARDDNGHPFVKFTWYAGYIGAPYYGYLIAKRWEEGMDWKELSDAEKHRLGMDLDEEEHKRMAEARQAEEDKAKAKDLTTSEASRGIDVENVEGPKEEPNVIARDERHKRELSKDGSTSCEDDERKKKVKREAEEER